MCMNIHPPFLSHGDPSRAFDRDTTVGITAGPSEQPEISTVLERIEAVPHPVPVLATAEEVLCNG